MKSNKKGFTIVELLIVIVIIGILAAIAISLHITASRNGQSSAASRQI